jgi:formate hydrogenlyase transcriptional activator
MARVGRDGGIGANASNLMGTFSTTAAALAAVDAAGGESFLRAILESSPNIIYLYSVTEDRYVYVSPQSEAILGYPADEIARAGPGWLPTILHPDDRTLLQRKIEQLTAAADGEVVAAEYRVRHRDGQWRTVSCRNVVFSRLPDGRVEQFVGTVIDVTGARAREQALRESETRLRLATEAAQIGTWSMDLRPGNAFTWSESLAAIFGLPADGVYETCDPFQNLVHPDDVERLERTVGASIAECAPYRVDFRIVRPDGSTRWLRGHGQPLAGPDRRAEQIVGLTLDLTEHKLAEEALRKSEERYRSVVENQTELICHYLPDTTLTFVNDAYCRYFGRTRDELVGRSFMDLIPPAAHAAALAHLKLLLAEPKRVFALEHQVIARDGEIRWQEWIDQRIVDADGNVTELQGIGRDVTARHKAEDALREALAEVQRLKDRLQVENTQLQERLVDALGPAPARSELIFRSASMRDAVAQVHAVASNNATVLILGETGTGKELFAKAVHALGPRKDRVFVRVNCGALPTHLIESELFGHERGAFTGASARRAGRFELADGGTLFLDEIGELPRELQPKLLRVLQDGEFERVGGGDTLRADVRVIAATNRELAACVREGTFRADLFYRLHVFPIRVPPLRERREDIPLLAAAFLEAAARRLRRDFDPLAPEVLDLLARHDWPGNVRELQNMIERAAVCTPGRLVRIPPNWLDQPPSLRTPDPSSPAPAASATPASEFQALARQKLDLEALQRAYIREILAQTHWRIDGPNGAARILGLPPSTLRSRMKKLKII